MKSIKKFLVILRTSHFGLFLFSITIRNPLIINLHRFINARAIDVVVGLLVLPFSILYFLCGRLCFFSEKQYKLVNVVMVKNEGEYIKELIDYYKLIKFDHLFIYDNDSTDRTYDILLPYIKNGYITYHKIHGKKRQKDVYNRFLNRYGHKCEYVAFFDADEYLFTSQNNTPELISNLFKKDCRIGAVGINWLIFGTSGHKTKPTGGIVSNYLYRTNYVFYRNKELKFIAISSAVMSIYNMHSPYMFKKYKYVDTFGNIVNEPYMGLNIFNNKDFCLYHYYTKSQEEFEAKNKRGNAFFGTKGNYMRTAYDIIDKDSVYDPSLMKKIERLLNEENSSVNN